MEQLGTQRARTEALLDAEGGRERLREIIEHQTLQAQLAPLRSWRKKNEKYRQILSKLKCSFCIFLFTPDTDDLRTSSPDGNDDVADDSVIPPTCEKIYFLSTHEIKDRPADSEVYLWGNLNDLVASAWKKFRGTTPNGFIAVSTYNISEVCIGLARALSEELPLRFDTSQCPKSDVGSSFWTGNPDSDEIVLVESTEDAENLAGVLYAHFRGAPLLCVAAPDLARIQNALLAIDSALGRTAALSAEQSALNPHAVSMESKNRFRDWLRDFGGTIGPSDLDACLQELEDASTSHLSTADLEATGERRITVLTAGVPYNFVHRGAFTWSKKPIGHLTGDKSLLLLTELYYDSIATGDVSINLLFDPGYFETRETENAIEELRRHFSHSMVLDGPTASIDSLMICAQTLPLEIIFFNTHGADNAIQLADAPLFNHLLVQWVSFNSYPIVINNSCLSWGGVGREFLRVGARGYIGTLWSVDAALAADFARHALNRMVLENRTIAGSVASFAGFEPDSRAYIFAGTANARMKAHYVDANSSVDPNLLYARHFAFALLQLSQRDKRLESLTPALEREFQVFRNRILAGAPSREVEMEIHELQLSVWAFARLSTENSIADGLAQKLFDWLTSSGTENAKKRLSTAYYTYSRVLRNRGNILLAASYLKKCIAMAETDRDESLANLHAELADVLLAGTDLEGARAAALAARLIYSELGVEEGVLTLDGRLGQLAKRSGQMTEAMEYAKHGYSTAVKLGNFPEQCAFKADEAQLLLGLNNPGEALKTAQEALRIARRNQDVIGELKITGIIGHCYLMLKNFVLAEQYARSGLTTAEAMDQSAEIASFCADLAEIAVMQKKSIDANGWYMRGLDPARAVGNYEFYLVLCQRMLMNAPSLRDWEAFGKVLIVYFSTLDMIASGNRHTFVSLFLDSLRSTLTWSDRREVENRLGALAALAAIIVKDRHEVSDDTKCSYLAIELHLLWLKKEAAHVRQLARMLDTMSEGRYKFEELTERELPEAEKLKNWFEKTKAIIKRF